MIDMTNSVTFGARYCENVICFWSVTREKIIFTLIPLGLGIKTLPLNWKVSDFTKFEGTEWFKNIFLKEVVFRKIDWETRGKVDTDVLILEDELYLKIDEIVGNEGWDTEISGVDWIEGKEEEVAEKGNNEGIILGGIVEGLLEDEV